jgi:hypothetical protein
MAVNRSRWPHSLSHGSVAAHLLGLWEQILPGACMSVSCECYVLSGRGLCVRLITHPEGSHRVCVCVCFYIHFITLHAPLPCATLHTLLILI